MKKLVTLLKILLVVIVTIFLMTCCSQNSTPHCPTYADTFEAPIGLPPVVMSHYDTVVSLKGDTTLMPIPYEPTKGEKIAVNIAQFTIGSIIILSLISSE